jgi:hypothetical protein
MKRPLLKLLIGSVLIGAALGVFLVLRGKWGWFEVRVILTTITIAAASLCGLACDMSKTPRGTNLLPLGGLTLTLLSAVMLLAAVWFELESEAYLKATGCISILAIATVHVCLLSIARLARRFYWVYMVTCQVIYGLALLLMTMLIWEIDNDRMYRFVVAVSIVNAALTLVIPLLHRISRTSGDRTESMTVLEERNVAAVDEEIARLTKRLATLERLRMEIAGGADEEPQQHE